MDPRDMNAFYRTRVIFHETADGPLFYVTLIMNDRIAENFHVGINKELEAHMLASTLLCGFRNTDDTVAARPEFGYTAVELLLARKRIAAMND